jgi:hypothetical protein
MDLEPIARPETAEQPNRISAAQINEKPSFKFENFPKTRSAASNDSQRREHSC